MRGTPLGAHSTRLVREMAYRTLPNYLPAKVMRTPPNFMCDAQHVLDAQPLQLWAVRDARPPPHTSKCDGFANHVFFDAVGARYLFNATHFLRSAHQLETVC